MTKAISWISVLAIMFTELVLVNYFFFAGRGGFHFFGYFTGEDQKELFLIFLGSGLITFLSTVLAQKQDERLKNSSFGALASGVITLIITFLKKDNQQNDLLYAFLGSAIGAFNGWLVYLSIAVMAFLRYNVIIPFIELVAHGLDSMSDNIVSYENAQSSDKLKYYLERLASELNTRIGSLDNIAALDKVNEDKTDLATRKMLLQQRKEFLESIARFILTSIVELFNLVYGSMRFRASILKFQYTRDANGKKIYQEGRHWLYYYGSGQPFRKDKTFDQTTSAYDMVSTGDRTMELFDLSSDKVADRQAADRYQYFSLFRLNDWCILTLDWALKPDNTVSKSIITTIQELLAYSLVDVLASITERIMHIDEQLQQLDSQPPAAIAPAAIVIPAP